MLITHDYLLLFITIKLLYYKTTNNIKMLSFCEYFPYVYDNIIKFNLIFRILSCFGYT